MKKYFIIITMALGLLAIGACNEVDTVDRGEGRLSIVLVDEDVVTKVSDNTALTYEKQVNRLDVFVFQGSTLYMHEAVTSGIGTSGTIWSKTYESVPSGGYTVYAVANDAGVASLTTISAIESKAITLDQNSRTAANGFVMAAQATAGVSNGATATAEVHMSRFVSRVRLVSVTNAAPAAFGVLTVKAAFLENVWGTWNIGGANGDLSQWVNLAGRAASQNATTDVTKYVGYNGASTNVNPSAYASQVFTSLGSADIAVGATKSDFTDAQKYLYAFPSTVTADQTGPIADANKANGALPRLVVVAMLNGTEYFYPVTLYKDAKGLERNYTYDVTLTVKGTGSDDPNKPVGKGNLTATVTVNNWTGGTEYTEEI